MMNPNVGFRPPIILLKDGTDTSQGKAQLISNINACQAVVEAIRTTLGPRGMDKLIHDGSKVSTSSCAARNGKAGAAQGRSARAGRPRRGAAAPSLARWCSGLPAVGRGDGKPCLPSPRAGPVHGRAEPRTDREAARARRSEAAGAQSDWQRGAAAQPGRRGKCW